MRVHPKQVERWAKLRERGRSRYVWRYGVLAWGLTTGVMWALVMAGRHGWDSLPLYLAFGVPGFSAGGYLFGVLTWEWSGRSGGVNAGGGTGPAGRPR